MPANFERAMLKVNPKDNWPGYEDRAALFDEILQLRPDRWRPAERLFRHLNFLDHTLYRQRDNNLVLLSQPYQYDESEVHEFLNKIESRLVRWDINKEWSFYYPKQSYLIYIEVAHTGKLRR